jgi:hypothetical protein
MVSQQCWGMPLSSQGASMSAMGGNRTRLIPVLLFGFFLAAERSRQRITQHEDNYASEDADYRQRAKIENFVEEQVASDDGPGANP